MQYVGPNNNSSHGSHARKDQSRRYAQGVNPNSFAFSSLINKVAAAPSVKKLELAAVWVPYGLTKAGLSSKQKG